MHSPRSLREEWLDPAVVRLRPAAPLDPAALGELRERIAAGAAAGARWVVVDLAGIAVAGDDVAEGLVAEARALRARRGEL
ncbi:MAG TPA: hypothetical protein VN213_01880, partial [Solirubrobacteraceae bacterium]|nr:hypothetical protein [Solirubrobacteraceae bacterium]